MAENMTDVVAKKDFDASQAEIADLRKRLEATKEDRVKEQVSALEKSIAARDEEIKTLKTEIDNSKAAKSELAKSLETAKAEVESAKTKLADAEKKLTENTKSVVKANRISALVDKGVDKAEAEKIVTSAADASDELFTVILDTHAKLVAATKAAAMTPEEKEKAKKKEKQAAKADEVKLEEAKTEEEEIPLSTDASIDEETDSVVASVSAFLSQELGTENK